MEYLDAGVKYSRPLHSLPPPPPQSMRASAASVESYKWIEDYSELCSRNNLEKIVGEFEVRNLQKCEVDCETLSLEAMAMAPARCKYAFCGWSLVNAS